ncbi:MAG: maleylpyruvate isomerase family mycothiol-dependent enzyme [Acidimicrobiia bacterium]
MPSAENLEAIQRDGALILQLALRDPESPVPHYPEWDMRDLVSHTASIHGRTAVISETLPKERVSAPRLPSGADVFEWYAETLSRMLDALRAADSGATVWSFSTDHSIAFWERRMVVETGVHRWDAESSFGEEGPLETLVAVQGLDEYAQMWLPQVEPLPPLEAVALDLERTWRFGDGRPELRVEGTASDIYLRLMSRPGVDLPEVWADAVDGLARPRKS